MQETHSTVKDESWWASQWGGKAIFAHGTNNARGVMILVRKKVKVKIDGNSIIKDQEGRMVSVKFRTENEEIRLINIYAPNNDDPKFFQQIGDQIDEEAKNKQGNQNTILVGDFNLVLNLDKDKVGGNYTTHEKARETLLQIIENFTLVDIWRKQHYDEQQFTWEKYNPDIILVRLDYILVSQNLTASIPKTDIAPSFMSDHAIPYMILKPSETVRGPGFWRLNVSLLEETEYVEEILQIIKNGKAMSFESFSVKWEYIKMTARGFSIKYSARKKKGQTNALAVLDRKIDKCKLDLLEGSELFNKQQIVEHLGKLEHDKQEIIEYKMRGACIRARREWLKNGEKNSKMFFNLEKQNNKKKNRTQIRLDNGKLTNNNKEILAEQERFYKDLYTSREVKIDPEYLDTLNLPKITNEENIKMSGTITAEELDTAIKMMDNDKVPGLDGFPVEFHKKFWSEIKGLILELANEVVKKGFALCARRGIISLIEKVNKDILKIPNWRPLSLLSVDFKLVGKVLANRLYEILPNIIHREQSGFMKNRSLNENIMNLLTEIEYCTNQNIEALLISFDFCKAFDCVEWNVLYEIMHRFNISEEFTNMIKALYSGIESCTVNNGFSSNYFQLTRGLRQGCTLSPPAFLIYVEVLGEKIRQNEKIKGIYENEQIKPKHGQFADDLWAIVKAEEESYREIIKEFDLFEKNTGLKINYDKTQVVRIGSMRKANAKYYSEKPIQWSEGTKILGFHIRASLSETIELNYNNLYDKIQSVLNVWMARQMTLIGRIQIVNTLVASLATQIFTCLPAPKEFFKKTKHEITKFLWKNKKPKIAYEKLIQTIGKGGLKLVDLEIKEAALKVTWVKKSTEEETPSWQVIASELLPLALPDIWEANIDSKEINKLQKANRNRKIDEVSLWHEIWKKWADISLQKNPPNDEIAKQMLYLNINIRKTNQVLKPDILYQKGINNLIDIYDWQGKKFLTYKEVKEKFNLENNFLDYAALIKAIPSDWKRKLKNGLIKPVENADPTILDTVINKKKIAKEIYSTVLKEKAPKDSARITWNHELNVNIGEEDWEKLRIKNYKTTLSVKLKYFQYRILSKRLTTNVLRHKWDKNISDQCDLCNRAKETTAHLMYDCPKVNLLWKNCEKWLLYICKIELKITKQLVILNNYVGQFQEFINTVLQIAKQYIYATKCLKQNLNFVELITKINEMYRDETYIAKREHKMYKNEKKWNIYKQTL